MAQYNKYAFVKPNGKVISITKLDAQTAAQAGDRFVAITDETIQVGDKIDLVTGAVIDRNTNDTQESRQSCRELVRKELRATDWTQLPDAGINNAKKTAWATYRAAIQTNWNTAKATSDPLTNMVWPTPPGDASDGL
jgi:hypothetical protein